MGSAFSRRKKDLSESGSLQDGNDVTRRASATLADDSRGEFRGTVDRSGSFQRDDLKLSLGEPEWRPPPGIDYTPIGDEKDTFKFYCPLCMLYFKEIHVTKCCNNSICYACTLNYIRGKGGLSENLAMIPDRLPSLRCPHCGIDDVNISKVSGAAGEASVRCYAETPRGNTEGGFNSARDPSVPQSSPLKIGDSFENLQRKMLRFEESGNNANNNHAESLKPPLHPRKHVSDTHQPQTVLGELPDIQAAVDGTYQSPREENEDTPRAHAETPGRDAQANTAEPAVILQTSG